MALEAVLILTPGLSCPLPTPGKSRDVAQATYPTQLGLRADKPGRLWVGHHFF